MSRSYILMHLRDMERLSQGIFVELNSILLGINAEEAEISDEFWHNGQVAD